MRTSTSVCNSHDLVLLRTDVSECVCAGGVTLHRVPLTLTFLAFPHLTFFSREFSLSQNL